MIKLILSFLILAKSQFLFGQDLGDFDVVNGFDNYPLGSTFKDNDSSLKLVEGGKFEYKGRVEYSYQFINSIKTPHEFGGILFQNVILCYTSNKLARENFFKVYTPKLDANYKKSAKRDFKQLYSHLQNQWMTKGDKETLYNTASYVVTRYKWESQEHTMTLIFHENKGANPSYTIDIYLELNEYK